MAFIYAICPHEIVMRFLLRISKNNYINNNTLSDDNELIDYM